MTSYSLYIFAPNTSLPGLEIYLGTRHEAIVRMAARVITWSLRMAGSSYRCDAYVDC